MSASSTPGSRFRAALTDEKPLQVIGAINAYTARMAERVGFKALYVSGGGVAANSLGMPDLAISTLESPRSARRIGRDASAASAPECRLGAAERPRACVSTRSAH